MSFRLTASAASLAGLLLLGGGGVLAQTATASRTPRPPDAVLYFIDLADGARIPETSTVRFGVRNIGIAPAGVVFPNSGHHHLLVDTELPPLDRPIPNDFKHLHFGAGQTEAEVTLAPGEHTLQLLLADHNHVPHDPPIVSPQIRVVVASGEASTSNFRRKPSPKEARVYFTFPRNGSRVPPEFIVRFNLRGLGVAPAGVAHPNTGHHHLLVDTAVPPLDRPIPNDFKHLHFGAGQTEARVTLTPGRHTLQLLVADENHVPHDPPIMSERIQVVVGQRSRSRRR